jgi:alginate O-acetyltransferase complex protein AlgI
LLTGLWHGANWNFVIWGLFHGFFLAVEHMGFSKLLNKAWKPIQHLYLILVILTSWVVFRADNLSQAIDYFSAMGDVARWQTTPLQFARVTSSESIYVFAVGLLFTMPIYPWLKNHLAHLSENRALKIAVLRHTPRLVFLSGLLLLSILKIASSTYNPFIYFRF